MRPDAPDNMHADEPRRDTGKTAATKDPATKPKGDTKPVETPPKTEKKPPREPEVYSRTPVPSKPTADAETAKPKPAEKPVNVTPAEGDPRNAASAGNAAKDGKPAITPTEGDPRKDAGGSLVKDEKPVNATPLETEPKDKTADEKPTGVHARTPIAADPAVGAPALGRAAVRSDEPDLLLAKESRDDLQDRWQALQLRFIDDPRNVAKDAGSLVEESLEQLRTALNDRKRELDDWNTEGTVDTERLRRVVCDYRELFDNVLGH